VKLPMQAPSANTSAVTSMNGKGGCASRLGWAGRKDGSASKAAPIYGHP
jgi:hypothetical protein